VITLDLTEASAKIRSGGPVDDEEDMSREVWAGQIPLKLAPQPPIRDGHAIGEGDALPPQLTDYFR
jgi:hypothetical protein